MPAAEGAAELGVAGEGGVGVEDSNAMESPVDACRGRGVDFTYKQVRPLCPPLMCDTLCWLRPRPVEALELRTRPALSSMHGCDQGAGKDVEAKLWADAVTGGEGGVGVGGRGRWRRR